MDIYICPVQDAGRGALVGEENGREKNLIRSLLGPEATTIKQEGNRVEVHRLPITVSIHELLQLCASLDPEKHLIPILQKLVNF